MRTIEFALGVVVHGLCIVVERSTKTMSNEDVRCPDRCECHASTTDYLRVPRVMSSSRKIDRVFEGNQDNFAVRKLHGIDSTMLNAIERIAQDAYALGLSTKCAALRSLHDQLDAEWANELTATAAACS